MTEIMDKIMEDDIVGVCDTLVQMGIFSKDVHTADGVTSWMSETLKAQVLDRKRLNLSLLGHVESKICSPTESEHSNSYEAGNAIRRVFWHGLLPHFKDVSSHKYDQPTTFDELRVRFKYSGRSYDSELKELKSIVKMLSTQMGELKETVSQFVQPVQSSSDSTSRREGNRRFGTSTNFRNSYHTGPVCWRCGKPGHLQMNWIFILVGDTLALVLTTPFFTNGIDLISKGGMHWKPPYWYLAHIQRLSDFHVVYFLDVMCVINV
ncbi:hypothetical protein LOTGIDRAFT_163786 [Lottia gigantea]|uniref:CCHC-type domain-containing protein n=1 Tax=Lottia gigantea TaxID=225164 RepID=V3ZI14_LOTGI|nr:hypothetical protein LOTGIDRAFT_163786 [Lottia gigantea]ESO90898.1 hypothetical protein LOTGIDRAFT_163786 [Lottia gigantea]